MAAVVVTTTVCAGRYLRVSSIHCHGQTSGLIHLREGWCKHTTLEGFGAVLALLDPLVGSGALATHAAGVHRRLRF
jgi:hypothetical protein